MQGKILVLIVPGKPIPKQRSRKGAHGTWYNPQTEIMEITKRILKEQLPDNLEFPISSKIPIKCKVYAFFLPPKKNKKNRYEHDNIPCLNKKDVDNLAKFYMDVMNKLVYNDDNQIYSLLSEKYYSLNTRTEIQLEW
jgi:Holliday junction resolvase RusA-like endonuclease